MQYTSEPMGRIVVDTGKRWTRKCGSPRAYASETHRVAMLATGLGMASPKRRLSTAMAAAVISSEGRSSHSCMAARA